MALRSILIVLPPIEKQKEIAIHIKAIRDRAKQLENEAKEILTQAKKQVEGILLGE
jgi:type I restriction enzyme S subunit